MRGLTDEEADLLVYELRNDGLVEDMSNEEWGRRLAIRSLLEKRGLIAMDVWEEPSVEEEDAVIAHQTTEITPLGRLAYALHLATRASS